MTAPGFSTLALAAVLAVASSGVPAGAAAADDSQDLVAGNTVFALNLYARLKAADGNLFFSPWSISTCLAMTCAGARGETAAQMGRTLHFDTDPGRLAASFAALQRQLDQLAGQKGVELAVANGLWAQQDHPFAPAYLGLVEQSFEARLRQVDFRIGAEAARTEINDWAGVKTKGRITGLIPPGALDQATRLVLANAIWFKGSWAWQFDPANTTTAPFSVTPAVKAQAPLMSLTGSFKYAETPEMQLLELPYAGGALAMVVLLPRESDGLEGLQNRLDEPALAGWLAGARAQKVSVFLPKFRLAAQFNLAKTLAAMGMTDAFSPQADLSGMDGDHDLRLSDVFHKAFVEVNEEGTEAAAATGTVVRSLTASRPAPIPTFRADHPFVFLIRDTRSGSILFLGRVADPTRS